ncbi:MAG: DUF952 domain-containing protein [Planctomycetota bacterium]|nr:DUF952 domain-containing protein [Planctomycetota bacterium]
MSAHATPQIVFHITTPEAWEAACAAGGVAPPSLEAEGFVHCSTIEQIPGTLARHFAGRTGLIALMIDTRLLSAPLRWEPVRDERFPHVHGPINIDAVVGVQPLADQ